MKQGRAGVRGGAPVHEVQGVVAERLPRGLYRVRVDAGHEVLAHAAGGMRKNFVRLIEGDRVVLELAPRDLGRGRIVRRCQGSS